MSAKHFYDLCHKYMGRPVKITTRDGKVHCGIINHVDQHRVYLHPLQSGGGLGGFGYGGFYGPGYGPGFGYGIALGAIGTLALLPLFYW